MKFCLKKSNKKTINEPKIEDSDEYLVARKAINQVIQKLLLKL